MSTDFAWLAEHSLEIYEKYAGRWIAVFNGAVIATGDTADEAARAADMNHQGELYILEWIEPESEHV